MAAKLPLRTSNPQPFHRLLRQADCPWGGAGATRFCVDDLALFDSIVAEVGSERVY